MGLVGSHPVGKGADWSPNTSPNASNLAGQPGMIKAMAALVQMRRAEKHDAA